MLKRIWLVLLLLASGAGQIQKYYGPKCLGSFCIDRRTSIRVLFKQLGPPARKAEPYCYESSQKDAFLYLKTEEHDPTFTVQAFLSDFPNCMHTPRSVAAGDLHGWKTREGIGLGTPLADVIKAYGKPSEEWMVDLQQTAARSSLILGYRRGDAFPHTADKAIKYNGDLGSDLSVAEFGIRDGKVSWIWLSCDE